MIPLLPVEEAVRRGKEAGLDERFSSLNAFRVMLHNSRAAGAVAELLRTLMFRNTVNARSRELVILRNGWRTRSEYEFCQHVRVSRDLKMTEDEILGIRDPDNCPAYSETDRAVIRMADELLDHSEVFGRNVDQLAESVFERGIGRVAVGRRLLAHDRRLPENRESAPRCGRSQLARRKGARLDSIGRAASQNSV